MLGQCIVGQGSVLYGRALYCVAVVGRCDVR